MAADGSLIFDTKIDTVGFGKGTNTIKKQASGLKSAFLGLGKAIGIAFGVSQLIKFGKQAINAASDLQEVQNVVDTAFGSMAYKMEQFADTAIESFGISKLAAKQTGSTFMAMARGMGLAMDNSSDMAISLTALSADMASFYNVSQDVASTALKSVFTGETETLKQYGIVMTEANLQAFAMSQGIKKKISAMSQAEKVQLRYNYVMQQTALAQGDFARTSDSWANQTRVLSERWKEFLGIIGAGLMNVLTPMVKFLNTAMSYLISFATTAGKVLSTFFNIKSAVGDTSAAISGVGASSEAASSGIEGIGNSAEKAAKKAKKSTSSIDDLNILTKNVADNAEGASDALGNMGGGGNYGMDITPVVNEAETSKFEKSIAALAKEIKKTAQIAATSFMDGFKEGLGEVNLDSITDHIRGIGGSLKDIFTDPKVQKAAEEWVKSTSKSLGKITGSMVSIGLTVAELFVGSIDKYLSQNSDFLKDKIVDIFDLSAKGREIYANFMVAVADIFTVFRGEKAKQIGADLIAIFVNSYLSITTLGMQFGNDILAAITNPIINNKESIKTALDNSLGIISEVVGSIKDFIENSFEAIKSAYDEYIAPAIEKFSSGFETIFTTIVDTYNDYFAPTFDAIAGKIDELINGPIADLVESAADTVGKLVDGIATLWDETIAPFLAWLWEKFAPGVSESIGDTADTFLELLGIVAGVVADLLDALGGIIDFIVGVFTGDWEKAWEGIKTFFDGIIRGIKKIIDPIATFFKEKFEGAWTNVKDAFAKVKEWFTERYNDITGIFKNIPTWFKDKFTEAWTNVKDVFSSGGKVFDGIKDGIADTFKTVVNKLIDGINRVLAVPFNKINSMLNSIRSVSLDLGVTKISPFSGMWSYNPLSVPSIPKLATGAVVPANYGEFAAILGDNKREAEVVSPLSTMKQALKEAMKEMGGGSGNINLTVNLDGQPIYQTVVKYNNRNTRITGRNALLT